MPLPDLTHLQFLVLASLMGSKRAGRELRAKLAEQGVRKTGPAFYQLMARMEDARLVKGWYEQKIVDGQIIKQRWYEARADGLRAYNATREFYLSQVSVNAKGGLVGA